MLCAIRGRDNAKIIARLSSKEESPFYCPSCRGELNIRKGRIKIHHFAHKPPFNCTHGEGETEAHRKCKETLYNLLSVRNNLTLLDIESNLGIVIPDIYAQINGIPVAIEIQKSNLSVNEITYKTQKYHELGINVLWLALYNDKLINDKYSPSAWEKWCHATYFGRVYYWLSDLTVVPVHFADYQLYVEDSNWYDSSGNEMSAGGYFKTSKRYRTPQQGNLVNIAEDFIPNFRKEWQGGSVFIPTCRIYTDKQKTWWKK